MPTPRAARRGAVLAMIAAASLSGGCAESGLLVEQRRGHGYGHVGGNKVDIHPVVALVAVAAYGGAVLVGLCVEGVRGLREAQRDGPGGVAWDSPEGRQMRMHRVPPPPRGPRTGPPVAEPPPAAKP